MGGVPVRLFVSVRRSGQRQPPRLSPPAGPAAPAGVRRAAPPGRSRSPLSVPTFPPIAPACSWVCSLACVIRADNGRWCTRISRGPPNGGGAPAGPAVPPQHCWVLPPKSGARAISPSLAGSSPRAHRGPPLTRGRGFGWDERPQVSSPSGQLHAGHNAHRARPGGPAAPPTFRQLGRTI
ncbi:hypothetical protein NDU88_003725 [Pleurodeles waltl]|uniref:Uncharacterized protein n=1 Tax=Pleurodeles waltl TaxID=8319 RepID=A0AAV7T643_PLEWA|nr:hypothetical protein NDU88_003725 [Pleurodeles waltl]